MERKNIDYPLSLESVDKNGAFTGYASVFNVTDSQKDLIIHGAFARTIRKENNIKFLWQHHPDEPIGVITKIREDVKGLYIEGKFLLDVQKAKEAYSLLKSGAIDGLSIGYTVVDSEIDPESGVRLLKEVDLWEVSLVTFPANASAGITSVKSNTPQTLREFEHFLRDAGFSRKSAKSISVNGWQRDADEVAQLNNALLRAVIILST